MTATIPSYGHPRLSAALRSPVSADTWRRTLHVAADLPIACAVLAAATTALAVGVGLLPLAVGLPVLAATVTAARHVGRFERARTRTLLGATIDEPAPAAYGWSLRDLVRRTVDPAGWRTLLYAVVALPVSTAGFTVVVTGWGCALAGLTSPVWAPLSSDGGSHLGGLRLGSPAGITVTVLVACALAYLMPPAVRLFAKADVAVARGVLGR